MQWLIPVAMGLWAIWTWAEEQAQNRRDERARLAALYVNPFLSACEDLQSRIYHILELDGLQMLRSRYPDGTYAEETLYLIVRYFGWTAAIRRYSPYAQDPIVTKLIEKISSVFATSNTELPVGPFNFFHTEQKALGKMVMHRDEGQHGAELDTISCYAFEDSLASPPLSESLSVQQSLCALRETQRPEQLPGRERLVTAQRYLVDLLRYIEVKEGYSFFLGERKKCGD